MKALIAYKGGKARMASKIVELLPEHEFYGEPYCGSCAVMLRKGIPPGITNKDKYMEVINDKEDRLIKMYRYLKENGREFWLEVDKILCSKTEFEKAVEIWKNAANYSDKEIAVAMFVMHNQGFAGGSNEGWGRSKRSNRGSRWDNKKDTLKKFETRFSKCTIDCIDALEFIKKYDREGGLFYCDPPYPETDQRYRDKYSVEDFQNLIELAERSKASFVISSYGGGEYSDTGWQHRSFHAISTSARDKTLDNKRTEIVSILDRSGL